MGHDCAAWSIAVLTGVAIFESALVVRKLELYAAAHRLPAVVTLSKFGEVTQISLAVWAGLMSSELVRLGNLQDPVDEVVAIPLHMLSAAG
jgi:hypothetical protein